MNVIESYQDFGSVQFSRHEPLILNAALNEICNGIDVFEFETRVGAGREHVADLLKRIGSLLDDMDALPD